jgi:hypothetical protein
MNNPNENGLGPKWFDNFGLLQRVIPQECVSDCAHPGPCDDDVAFWRAKLEFEIPRDLAIKYLREFGAWTAEELSAQSDENLAEKVLWLACGTMRDGDEWFGLMH